ncbi:MAG: hypothetical protein ACT4P0_06875 [Panacagrimonas sp.]
MDKEYEKEHEKQPLVTAVFADRDSAEWAYGTVTARGYGIGDVNLAMSDSTRKAQFGDSAVATELGNKAAEGAGVGGAIGGTVGAIAAAIAAAGTTLLLPGLGLVIAGPLAAAAAGAGAGAAAGGLLGALIGWGIPEARVKEYESAIKGGKILMAVQPRTTEDRVHFDQTWRQYGGIGAS